MSNQKLFPTATKKLTQRHNWYGKIGKEITPKTISHHNQKTDLCNRKLLPAATKKDTTAQLVW
jgi:hypothetical protein